MKGGKKLSLQRRIYKFFKYRINKLLLFRKNKPTLLSLRGKSLIVLPEVFHPGLYNTSPYFAESISNAHIKPSDKVLDLGTGSGVGAIFAAGHSHHVVATDINPNAVRCASINALLNDVADRIDTRLGDLFEPVEGETFDLILYNPPFYLGKARNWHEMAFKGGEEEEHVCHKFFSTVANYLTPEGRVRMLWSTIADYPGMEEELMRNGLEIIKIEQRDIVTEVVLIYEFRPKDKT